MATILEFLYHSIAKCACQLLLFRTKDEIVSGKIEYIILKLFGFNLWRNRECPLDLGLDWVKDIWAGIRWKSMEDFKF